MKDLFYRKFMSMWHLDILQIITNISLSLSPQHMIQCFLQPVNFQSNIGNKQLISDTLVFQRCGGLSLSGIHIVTLEKRFSNRGDVARSLAISVDIAVAEDWRCYCYLGREIRHGTKYWKWSNLYNKFVNSPKGQ